MSTLTVGNITGTPIISSGPITGTGDFTTTGNITANNLTANGTFTGNNLTGNSFSGNNFYGINASINTLQPRSGNLISVPVGYNIYSPGTPVQTVINRVTSSYSTSSSTLSNFFNTSITIKTVAPIIMVFLHCKQRCDVSGTWNLAYFQIYENLTATPVAYSGYNGVNASGWIHDYTTEKPFYAPGAIGTTYTFALNVGSYSGTQYFNSPSNSSDDGYAIMKLTEIAR